MLIKAILLSLVLAANASRTPRDPDNGSQDTNIGIIGGQAAPEGAYPHLVSIRTSARMHNCDGSILNTRWILSAAHCTQRQDQATSIVAGSNRLDIGGTEYQIDRWVNHERYIPNGENDISLIRVSRDIAFTGNVGAISLAHSEPSPGSTVIAAGFGRTHPDGQSSLQLMHVNLVALSNQECSKIKQKPIPQSQVCTSALNGQGICQGDSGGPLMQQGSLVGVVSWSSVPCGTLADGYTKVSFYVNWIQSHMN